MFKNFELDLTYDRKINHPLATDDVLFEGSRIRVRKNIIVMGANASGKTTFGKLLCAILNFIRGRNLDNEEFSLSKIQYDKTKDASFEMEFVIGDTAYLLKASFRDFNLHREEVYTQKIHKSYNIRKLREKLNSNKPEIFDSDTKEMNLGFKSFIFSVSKLNKFPDLNKAFGFLFMFSEPELSWNYKVFNQEVDVEFLDKLLSKIDNSVKSVKRLQVEGETEGKATNSYQINFKNNENLIVVNGDLKSCGNRLSHGTFETIDFLSCLSSLKGKNLLYVDERLSHMHPELETYLARQAFFQKSTDSQLFFTTHDKEFFDLNAPSTAYILFKRNFDGFNSVVCVSDKINKNDRNLRNYYENDYFGTLPDYSFLDELFEDKEFTNA
jgi:ABC-type oligopeptide transport system ATPase subunit